MMARLLALFDQLWSNLLASLRSHPASAVVAGSAGTVLLVGAGLMFVHARALVSNTELADPMRYVPGDEVSAPESDRPSLRPPDRGQHLDQLRLLFQLARSHGISIGLVEHTSTDLGIATIEAKRMTLQASGAYLDFRKFLEDISSELPNAGLAEVTVERNSTDATSVTTTFELLLLYRRAKEGLNAQ